MHSPHSEPRHVGGGGTTALADIESLHRFQDNLDIASSKEELGRQLLERMRSFQGAKLVGLFLVDETSLELKLAQPRSAARYLLAEFELQAQAETMATILDQGAPAVLYPRAAQAARLGVRGLVVVPLAASLQTLGLLLLGAAVEPDGVTPESLELLSMAGKQFAQALRNRSLYESLWKEKIELQVAHDELRRNMSELERAHERLQSVVNEVRVKSSELEQLKGDLERKVDERTQELQEANRELDRLSNIDPLTGVFNRRHLDEAMAVETERAKRYGIKTALVIFDLNGLKAINDLFGHLMGDRALKEAAQLLQRAARKTDIVARFGGDEFVVIMPHTTHVAYFVKRVEAAIKAWNSAEERPPFELSMAVGFATAGRGVELGMALRDADRAMYENKATYYERR